MPELKAGDTKTFEIGGQKLVVEPLPFGNVKKLLRIVLEVAEKGKNGDAQVLSIPNLLENYADTAIPLLFRKGKHEFLTKDWIDDNMTFPELKSIFEAAASVNGLQDFFPKTVTARAPEAVETPSATRETPPESSGSTTSSVSPMDGSQERLIA